MLARKSCYSMRDAKVICSKCGDKMFLHKKPDGLEVLKCPNCFRFVEVDFSHKKDWYGGFDGETDIYDCIYCGSYAKYNEAQKDLRIILGVDAIFEDASDVIHEYRFSIKTRDNKLEYYRKIIRSGWAMVSLDFGLFMRMNVDKALELVQEWKAEKENG